MKKATVFCAFLLLAKTAAGGVVFDSKVAWEAELANRGILITATEDYTTGSITDDVSDPNYHNLLGLDLYANSLEFDTGKHEIDVEGFISFAPGAGNSFRAVGFFAEDGDPMSFSFSHTAGFDAGHTSDDDSAFWGWIGDGSEILTSIESSSLHNEFELEDYFGVASASAVVPEPSTWVLMSLGFGFITLLAARKRKKAPVEI